MVPGHLHRPGGFVDPAGPLGLEPATDESFGDGCWDGMIPVGFGTPKGGLTFPKKMSGFIEGAC